jgi:NAD(P)-dependent dehydrogenase (short-subunit alcohol dehydrogenase family)
MKRWGEADELAKAMLFLASSDISCMNGIELLTDGGATDAPFGALIYRS